MSSVYPAPQSPETDRTCTTCGETKALAEFYAEPAKRGGYGTKCKVCIRAAVNRYRLANREIVLARKQAYREANLEKVKAGQRRHYQENRDQVLGEAKAYYLAHKDRIREYQRGWVAANRDKDAARGQRRRERKNAASVVDFTARQWEMVKLLYGFRCAYCGCTPAVLHQEHVVPLSRGGNHTLSNIVPACGSCNARKHLSIWLPIIRPLCEEA